MRAGRLFMASTALDDTMLLSHLPSLAMPLAMQAEPASDSSARDELIALYGRAISLLPEDDSQRLHYQGMLAMVLQRHGSPRLDDAVDSLIGGVTSMPDDAPGRDLVLPPLAAALGDRGGRLREKISALSARREELRRALTETGLPDGRRAGYERELADVTAEWDLCMRRQSASLEQAIEIHRQIDADPLTDSRLRRSNLSNLSVALYDSYQQTGDDALLSEAVAAMRKAVDGSDDTGLDRVRLLLNLGALLRDVADARGTQDPLVEAAEAYATVAYAPAVPPRMRADAAAWWGYSARRLGDPQTALKGLALAVGLLDEVAWRGLSRQDQESVLADYGTLAVDAAAVAIELGQLERAIELLEQGRGILLAQILGTRANYDRLESCAPDLAAELVRIEGELSASVHPADAPLPPAGPARLTQSSPGHRTSLAAQRQKILEEIRRRPGLDGFLLPPSYATLARAAEKGPVIIINISEIRCDALVMTKNSLRLIPLAGISRKSVREVVELFFGAVQVIDKGNLKMKAEYAIYSILVWLNESITGPILDGIEDLLGATGPGAPPRVWWCPTGWLSFLPLHAAGDLAELADPTHRPVFDRVVSSYTPTVGALIYSRSARGSETPHSTRALMVAMPETPGLPALPNVGKEIEGYQNAYPGATLLKGKQASSSAVTEQMRQCSLVHFACHGGQDVGKSSASRVYLNDGPLSVADISALQITAGELAFLSACETAQASSILTDESLTISSAMLLAGFKHVVGTLWYVYDPLAPVVSNRFYKNLQDQGAGVPDAATALHNAVAALRAAYPHRPVTWAQYVHVGA
jgi:tetratricopeptide (TPR) repeat protein